MVRFLKNGIVMVQILERYYKGPLRINQVSGQQKEPKFIYYKDSGQLKKEDGRYIYYPDTSSSKSETLEKATQIPNGREVGNTKINLPMSDTKIKYIDLNGKNTETIVKDGLGSKIKYIDLKKQQKEAVIEFVNMYYVLKDGTTIIGVITEMEKSENLAEAREKKKRVKILET